MFRDRSDAGRQLAELLLPFKTKRPVVLALPRGGVPVGLEVSRRLDAPLDVLLVRKIGAPFQRELAVGAILDGAHPEIYVNNEALQALGLPASYVTREARNQLAEIERRRAIYSRGRSKADVRNRTVIVVDDGIATGATMRVALRALRHAGVAYLILAAPVAPADTAEALKTECDEAVFISTPDDFGAVGFYYQNFAQLTDADVVRCLDQAPAPVD